MNTQTEIPKELDYKCDCDPPGHPQNMPIAEVLLPPAACNLINLMKLETNQKMKFLKEIDTIFLDCDGVLWKSGEKLPGSVEVVNGLKKKDKRVILLTNNSTKTREEVAKKACSYGFNVTKEDIVCTSHLVAQYLKSLNFKKKVYILGSDGIEKELNNVGVKSTGAGPPKQNLNSNLLNFDELIKDPDVGAVVVGFDVEICFEKLTLASSYLLDPNILYIATNTDEVFPNKNPNIRIPGSGVMVAAVSTCTGRQPDIIMGKPENYMMKYIKEKYEPDIDRTLVVGDRANTDIIFGKRYGFKTLLVLTGITTLEESKAWRNQLNSKTRFLVADYYLPKLGDLQPYVDKL